MKLSTKGEYGLRAIIDIAENSKNGEYVSISDISTRQKISDRYLEKIIAKLKKSGLVKSSRGVNGGYILGKDPKCINMFDILSVLEDNIDVTECMDIHVFEKCNNHYTCKARKLWVKINEAVENVLKNTTLLDMIKQEIKKGEEIE
ncbi:MAG: hypothetical protein A2Y24_05835 [Clostridiales bacterium GWE2_32_10]|nr:MAG: hypothetical protein A2Y24_05835 [Clostridiales bacterium GWE2_32_10]